MANMDQGSLAERSTAVVEPARAISACPVNHGGAATRTEAEGVCPFPLRADANRVIHRSKADLVVRKILRISERPAGATSKAAYAAFQRSMMISAVRCTLTYVVFPFVVPAIGFATGVGPILGITIGLIAITCDVYTIRRFFAIDHKWRWHFSAIALGVICLLGVLMVQDIIHLATN